MIMDSLSTHGVMLCFMPGARFPPGSVFPEGAQYFWLGQRTTSWASIGCLVSVDIARSVEVLQLTDDPRFLWILILGPASVKVVVGGFYAAPGGDENTWEAALLQFHALVDSGCYSDVLLVCDGNVHFRSAVRHEQPCDCRHCCQSAVDRRIEAKMLATGLNVLNDGLPTHESGYVLDLVLGLSGSATSFTLPQFIAGSDHKMVVAQSSFRVTADLSFGLNTVSWSHSESWREGLNHIDQLLRHSGEVVDSVFIEIQTCSDVPKKRKRALLEAAAWIRVYWDIAFLLSKFQQPAVPAEQRRTVMKPRLTAGSPT